MIATVKLFDRFYDIEYQDNNLLSLLDSQKKQIDLHEDAFAYEIQSQLMAYENKTLKTFNLKYLFKGTDFQKKVWNALTEIPYGKTLSYQELAIKIGHPKAARAVGQACNRNPIGIIVPCHRVIGSDHRLTGYAGGLKLKEKLLRHEKALI
jgi:O-6-methylguanine DNA methyltransferase